MDSQYFMRFKALYEGNLNDFKKDAETAAAQTKAAKLSTQEWENTVKSLATSWGVSSQSIIRNLQQVNNEYDKLDKVLGRVGGRIGGAGLGSALGIPGGGFIGSQLVQGLGISGAAALGVGAAGVGIFAGVEIVKHIENLSKWAQEQDNVSKEIGITVGQMQVLSRISEVTGVHVDAAARAVSKLKEAMIQGGTRGRQVTGALDQLGLSSGVAFEDPARALDRIMSASSKISDEGTRIRLLTELLGEAGKSVAALADRWDELKGKQKIIPDDQIKALEDARERIKEMGQEWDILLSKLAKPIVFGIKAATGDLKASDAANAPGILNIPMRLMLGIGGEIVRRNAIDIAHNMPGLRGSSSIAGMSADQYAQLMADTAGANQSARLGESFSSQNRYRVGRNPRSMQDIDAEEESIRSQYSSATISRDEMDSGMRRLENERNYIQTEESIAALGKRSKEVFSTGVAGIRGLRGTPKIIAERDAALRKLDEEEQEALRKAPSRAGQIRSSYANQRIGIHFQYGAQIGSELDRQAKFFENAPYSTPESQIELNKKAMEVPEGPYGSLEKLAPLLGTGRGIGLLGGFDDSFTVPIPPGYVSPQEQLSRARNVGGRLQSLVSPLASVAGTSGQETADAAQKLRLITANAEYQAELRLAERKETNFEKDQARADALDKLNQAKFDAETEHQKSMLELYHQAQTQFAGGLESIILGAQNGGGRGARSGVRGFLEGQEGTIIRNIGGMIFNRIHLPHAGKGTPLGDILNGTIFGPREDNVKKIQEDAKRAADDLDKMLDIMQNGPSSTTSSKGGWTLPSGVTINPNGSIGGGAGSGILSDISKLAGIMTGGGSSSLSNVIFNGVPNSSGGQGAGSGGLGSNANLNNPVGVLINGSYDPGTSNTSARIGAGIQVAAAATGVYAGAQNIARGGGKNVAGGISEIAGSAALVDPEPISKTVLAGIAAISGLVSSFLGDPRAERAANINRRMFTQQYLAPPAENISVGGNGGYADVDAFGSVRTSNFSPYPRVNDPYLDNPHRTVIPGGVVSTYGGFNAGTGAINNNRPPVSITVQAIDAQSIISRGADIAEAVNQHIMNSDSGLMHNLNQRFQGRNN